MIVATIPIISQLEDAMRHVLNFFHASLGLPWAWAIVATTVVVRMILVPLMIRQIHSMQSLQQHAPEMKRIQQKYKHDKKKQNEELMAFYKENKINPAASCLPMLLQLPVFLALYYTLRHFDTNFLCAAGMTKQACQGVVDTAVASGDLSFLHFVPTISTAVSGAGYVLLVVYVVSQMASGFFMSPTAQKSQRVVFILMPLVFVFVIAGFPAGLVLYWVTTNLWTVGQGLITRRLVQKTPAPAPEKRTSRKASKDDDGTSGNGAAPEPSAPKPSPAVSAAPRQVRRKKSSGRRR
ncbi:MAG: YidC/Oxa1 family rane protein insertase [Gaiellaceae bacterium]|jgi:YidC/Oxa1 family membrane protein insertase|nr:YidC/Oxa1 family rane protein insertase [Gaiellaceae bacterium]